MRLHRPTCNLAFSLALLLVASSAFGADVNWPTITSQNRPWTYWWWMGSAVDEANLTRELEDFSEAGFGGVHIIPIYGAKGYESQFINYLTPTWMSRLGYTTSEASRLNLGVDMSTGTGWCFGGPTVSGDDSGAQVVHNTYEVAAGQKLTQTFDPQKTQALVAYGNSGEVVDLTSLIAEDGTVNWIAPSYPWTVHYVSQKTTGQMVKRAAPGGAGYMLNPFSGQAMTNYLKWFDDAFDDYTGIMPRSMYHDSYEYSSQWSQELFDEFEARCGYRLQTQLPALFGEGSSDTIARVKYDYRRTASEMIAENYIGQWDSWAGEKGMLTRNQAHGSPGNLLDLYAAADIPETEMFHNDRDPLIAKFASSAAHVMDKSLVSAETGTWLNEHFTSTLADIKYLVDDMFIGGVNHVVYHGSAYSPEEAGSPGWVFYASTEMNSRNAIWHDVPALNEYVARTQSITQSDEPDNDILVYWPIADQWHNTSGLQQQLSVHDTSWFNNYTIGKVANNLWGQGYTFDYVSDNQITQAAMSPEGITMPGGDYQVVVVPDCNLIPVETWEQLFVLAENGATVIFQNGLPEDVPGLGSLGQRRVLFNSRLNSLQLQTVTEGVLQQAIVGSGEFLVGDLQAALETAQVQRESMVDVAGIEFIRYANDSGNDYFIANRGNTSMSQWVPIATAAQSVLLMDPLSGKTGAGLVRTNEAGQTEVFLQLKGGESTILRTFANETISTNAWRYLLPAGNPVSMTGTWQVEFIDGGPVLPESFQTATLGSWTEQADPEAKRFAGTARYSITFDKPAQEAEAWVLDLGDVAQSARVFLNGKLLGTLFTSFQIELEDLQPTGNFLEVEVTNLSANYIRDLDIRGVGWKTFYDINFVNVDYRTFDASSWPIRDSGLLGPVQLLPMSVMQARIPGDANNDGKVGGSDVTILAGNWQVGVNGVGGATWEMGDFNGDGQVDGSDVTILAANWQYGVDTAAAAKVPEPGVLALLGVAAVCFRVVRRPRI